MSEREKWLNGWPRIGNSVLIGTGSHCAGCGKLHGVTCVAFSEGYVPPEKDPEWPFQEEGCPVCAMAQREFDSWPPRVVDLYRRLRICEAQLKMRDSSGSGELIGLDR